MATETDAIRCMQAHTKRLMETDAMSSAKKAALKEEFLKVTKHLDLAGKRRVFAVVLQEVEMCNYLKELAAAPTATCARRMVFFLHTKHRRLVPDYDAAHQTTSESLPVALLVRMKYSGRARREAEACHVMLNRTTRPAPRATSKGRSSVTPTIKKPARVPPSGLDAAPRPAIKVVAKRHDVVYVQKPKRSSKAAAA